MQSRFISISLLALLCIPSPHLFAQEFDSFEQVQQDIDLTRMQMDIVELSSDRFEGRQAGTPGGHRSADFVVARMTELGLVPAGRPDKGETSRSWLQEQLIPVPRLATTALLEFSILQRNRIAQALTTRPGTDFVPTLDSPSVNVTAPVVFVGYGIDDPARGVNDYEGIEVRNRIVMFLRGKPSQYPKFVTLADKEKTARQKGAIGFITVPGPILSRYEARRGMGHAPVATYSGDTSERPLPGCWISGSLGESLFESGERSLRDIQAQLNERRINRSHEMGILAHLRWDNVVQAGRLINVFGLMVGSDPYLRNETVVVGAHRDHFGLQAGLLFAGADDNASGSALILEVARLFSTRKANPKRSVLFASFSGEERGLLGSKLYVSDPPRPLNTTVAMINVDHVGVGNGTLTVGISRMSKDLGNKAGELSGLTNKVKLYGFFPGGDHVPFAKAQVPTVAVMAAGRHPSFHQPSDTAEKIRPDVLQTAARYVLAVTWLLANPFSPSELDWEENSANTAGLLGGPP